jgi:NAD(P)-dependent dehydrogenase (short-subunit alcohol dehydrogenase family)
MDKARDLDDRLKKLQILILSLPAHAGTTKSRDESRMNSMKPRYDIKDKIVVITGANRGIGRAITDVFLREGAAKIYAAVRDVHSVEPLVKQYGNRVIPVHLDLAERETISALAESAPDVQVVVNNAAVFMARTPLDGDAVEALELAIKVNVCGLMHMAQAFAPVLKRNGGGAFVQVNSIASLKCSSSFATHSASKAAAYSITQALRELLGQQGTLVLSVHPGLIATGMADSAGLNRAAEPPLVVAEEIVSGLKSGHFHLFPDSLAKRVGYAYESFAKNVIEADIPEYHTE